jgi:acrylyl-CoA reductase (NADPH)
LATGWGIGERHWGGFSRYARVKPEWLVRIPQGLTGMHAMALGTAGLTAMLCIEALEAAGTGPAAGEILVTGASGGVGSLAIMLLSALGYQPVASTGRPDQADYFQALGAGRIVARSDLDRESRPLEKEIWAGAIDTVGGRTLATALAQTRYGGTVAACGLAGDFSLPATVMPFILRNVRLQGVDSVYLPAERRTTVWQRLAQLLPGDRLGTIVNEVKLGDVPELAAQMLAGRTRGRSVVVMEH